jgi:hypothetical protein
MGGCGAVSRPGDEARDIPLQGLLTKVAHWCFYDTYMQEQDQAQSAVSTISARKFVLAR